MLPKQRETRRWSRPDVLYGIAGLTCLSVILRLELAGLLVPLIIQAWYMDRLDWLEGGATLLSSALAALSKWAEVLSITACLKCVQCRRHPVRRFAFLAKFRVA